MDLTISIVSFNTKDKLEACLNSIFNYTGTLDIEVFVIDNASKDNSVEMVKSKFPKVTVITNKENKFLTKAHNMAFDKAKGKYLLILNSDTLINDKTIDECVKFLENNKESGAITCKTYNSDGSFQIIYSKDYTYKLALMNYTFLGKLFPKTKKILNDEFTYNNDIGNQLKEVEVVGDANLWAKMEIIRQIDGYDDRFKLYYTENDICIKIRKTGHKIFYIPQGNVTHYVRQSVEKEGIRSVSQIYYEDTIKYYLKYNGFLQAVILAILIKITNLLLILKYSRNSNIFYAFLNHPKNDKK
ncbi:MAG: hypothetical protein A2252_03160 [Elusimicrobia bacterium RIFOXYA2_FULL_39_19]|nr:MAG: hypothetical protein A2252_03160 [Elusimicrobia bacterium RIFOXYA2_FULL_39_19]